MRNFSHYLRRISLLHLCPTDRGIANAWQQQAQTAQCTN